MNGDAHLGNFFLLQFLLIQQTRPTVTTSWVWLRYECVLEKGKLILLETTPYKLQYLAQWRISTSGNFHMLFTDALYGKGFFFHSVCTERVGGDLPSMLKKYISILKGNHATSQKPQQRGVVRVISY